MINSCSLPLYYIRFLKPPPKECLIGQHFTIVWTIESDLGDQTYWETVPITISLQGSSRLGLRELNADPKSNLRKRALKPYSDDKQQKVTLARDIPVTFDPFQGGGIVTKLVIEQLPGEPLPIGAQVHVQLNMLLSPIARVSPNTATTCHSVWQNTYQFQSQIWLIPTWSTPILTTMAKQRHVQIKQSGDQAERILAVKKQKLIHIREDAVQSIARHIWDCGLGMCQFLSEYNMDSKYNSILELGSGTGLVGIYAAELLKPECVYLTDLSDALEIMKQNVALMDKNDTNVKIFIHELAWGSEKQDIYGDVNLLLLTDVLYNQSSHDLLIATLDWMLDNPECKALLSYKERNPDERVFFTKIKEKGWKCERVDNYDHLICEIYWIYKTK
ncbi:putative methyltransferase-domain-containing protein [Cokeromyces recurvatus]|uniref:putative methyltransferase-domain-containing protein n=1 Tax=Cokeromyces recurvatus TaxID=90255 RepID=UPI002220C854|nr:putative methyltransferase-domain-containing protein [Cokeromyces recurvatus]KAI7901955.1 putative methyltransferase-domain-containing protein [Cokeromyces recurvatus]